MKIEMKKIFFILTLSLLAFTTVKAQDDERIRDKMKEYIQQRMRLTSNEAERFTPVFLRYFREWRTTLKDNKGDRLILQQKIVELRLRYRGEFKEIVGERRSNEIYKHQEIFIRELKDIGKERMKERGGGRLRFSGPQDR
jgi:hypothetical protein